MASVQEKAQCVIWLTESKSPVTVQRKYRTKYGKPPPPVNSIKRWLKTFMETGSVEKRKSSGRPRTSNETVAAIQDVFDRSPSTSVRRASRELHIPRSTLHDVLHKRLRLRAYKIQMAQQLKTCDYKHRYNFAVEMISRINDDENFLNDICFSDEATFHTSGKVNRQNVRIWGSERPSDFREVVRDSPKVNVWCGMLHNQIIGPFFFC